jgi:hypothetical protein
MHTPENIETLKENEVFVFGTNQFAIHAGGAAKVAAQKFGARDTVAPHGLCGNSYGIITTSFNEVPISMDFIQHQLEVLYHFAIARPDLTFYVTKIGTGIAGFSIAQMDRIFFHLTYLQPNNIILPKEFTI